MWRAVAASADVRLGPKQTKKAPPEGGAEFIHMTFENPTRPGKEGRSRRMVKFVRTFNVSQIFGSAANRWTD